LNYNIYELYAFFHFGVITNISFILQGFWNVIDLLFQNGADLEIVKSLSKEDQDQSCEQACDCCDGQIDQQNQDLFQILLTIVLKIGNHDYKLKEMLLKIFVDNGLKVNEPQISGK
jgi:hypothetical protein